MDTEGHAARRVPDPGRKELIALEHIGVTQAQIKMEKIG